MQNANLICLHGPIPNFFQMGVNISLPNDIQAQAAVAQAAVVAN